jgi:hypothetical protein
MSYLPASTNPMSPQKLIWISTNNRRGKTFFTLDNDELLMIRSGKDKNIKGNMFVILVYQRINGDINIMLVENETGTRNFAREVQIGELPVGSSINNMDFQQRPGHTLFVHVHYTNSSDKALEISYIGHLGRHSDETGDFESTANENIEIGQNLHLAFANPTVFYGGLRRASKAVCTREDLNPKFKKALDIFKTHITEKTVIFTSWMSCGLLQYKAEMKYIIDEFDKSKKSDHIAKEDFKVFYYSGLSSSKERKRIMDEYNNRPMFSNKDKSNDKRKATLLIITAAGSEGLDLQGTANIILTEPLFAAAQEEQVLGRAIRKNSHLAYHPVDQFVRIFRLLLVKPAIEDRPHLKDEMKEFENEKSVDMILFHKLQNPKRENVQVFHDRLEEASVLSDGLIAYYEDTKSQIKFINSEKNNQESDGAFYAGQNVQADNRLVITEEEEKSNQQKGLNQNRNQNNDDEDLFADDILSEDEDDLFGEHSSEDEEEEYEMHSESEYKFERENKSDQDDDEEEEYERHSESEYKFERENKSDQDDDDDEEDNDKDEDYSNNNSSHRRIRHAHQILQNENDNVYLFRNSDIALDNELPSSELSVHDEID